MEDRKRLHERGFLDQAQFGQDGAVRSRYGLAECREGAALVCRLDLPGVHQDADEIADAASLSGVAEVDWFFGHDIRDRRAIIRARGAGGQRPQQPEGHHHR